MRALLLLLFPLMAHAGAQWPAACAPSGSWMTNATGSEMRSGWDANGAWRGYWCLKTRYEWAADPVVHVQLANVQWMENANAQINVILSARDPQAAFLAALQQFNVPPTEAQLPAFRALQAAGEADMRANKPRDPQWRVAGLAHLRRAYVLTPSNELGQAAITQALVGAPCDCKSFAIAANESAWCPWLGAPERTVTLCGPAR